MENNQQIIETPTLDIRSTSHLSQVKHDYVRYANVWEDPTVLLEGFGDIQGKKILSIASAGDNVFAILTQCPSMVVAADINLPQLYLMELKIQAIKTLTWSEYLEFIGFRDHSNRLKNYVRLACNLTPECKLYWDTKQADIVDGLCYCGKFERYLATFAKKVLPLIHSKDLVKELFTLKSEEEQIYFYNNKWNTWRWKLLFKLFFSKSIMGILGRDKAFLAQVNVNVAATIKAKTDIHLSSIYAQSNPILFYCLNGHFGNQLPFYAQEDNFRKVKQNIENIHLEYGYIQDVGGKYGYFDRFNLSNIFEYMDEKVFAQTSNDLILLANQDALFAYWNLMVPREMQTIHDKLISIKDRTNWSIRDNGFFYDKFIVEQLEK